VTWIPHVSPTQVDDFNLCERKWAFRQFSPKEPPNIGAFRGDSGHRILEAYGKDRTPPEIHEANLARGLASRFSEDLAEKKISAEDYAARIIATCNKMIPLLPEPPWERIEEKFSFEIGGVTFCGRVDLQYEGNAIRDHKFSSSADFVKTPEILLTDSQALIYSAWKMVTEGLSEVRFELGYGIPGKKPRAIVVPQVMTAEHVDAMIEPIVERSKEIVRLRLARPDPLSLTPNWNACEAFGGCPYQDRCKPSAEDLIAAKFDRDEAKQEKKTMGLLNKAKAKVAETGGVAQGGKPDEKGKPDPGVRSDDGHAKKECFAHAAKLLEVGLSREDVVTQCAKKFVGLPADAIEACVPKPQAINPPDSPKEPEGKVEEKAPKGTKAKVKSDDLGGMVKSVLAQFKEQGLTVEIVIKSA